jgi:hypothetical protein
MKFTTVWEAGEGPLNVFALKKPPVGEVHMRATW